MSAPLVRVYIVKNTSPEVRCVESAPGGVLVWRWFVEKKVMAQPTYPRAEVSLKGKVVKYLLIARLSSVAMTLWIDE